MVLEGWKVVRLNELAAKQQSSFTNGPFGSNLLTSELRSSGVPVIYIRDIKDGFYKPKGTVYVDECKADELSACEVLPGDLLITKVGDPPAIASIYPDGLRRAIITQDVIRLRVDRDKSVPSFVRSLINSPLGHSLIEDIVIEGTRRRVSLGSFKQIKFLLPSLVEQKRISEILDSVDDAIAATQAVIDQTRKVKQGLLQQLLTRGIGHTKFKETAIGLIPESWEVVKLDDLKAKSQYSCVGGPFGSDLTSKDYRSSPGVPVIRGNNLSDNLSRFKEEGFVFVSEEKAKHLYRNLAYPDDLIFTQRGTLGQIGLIPDNSIYKIYLISQSQMKLTPNLEIVNSSFLYHYFLSPQGLQLIEDSTIATGVPHINLGILKGFPIPVPPIPEQSQIVDILNEVDVVIIKHYEQLKQLSQLKAGLMQGLLTGRVRVKDVV